MVYKDEGCRGGSYKLRGGKSIQSQNLSLVNFDKGVKSIKLCDERPYCLRLNATLFKFELSSQGLATLADNEYVSMTSKTVLFNNGSATVTQEYTAKKTISEEIALRRDSSLSEMNSVTTIDSVTTTTFAGFRSFLSSRRPRR